MGGEALAFAEEGHPGREGASLTLLRGALTEALRCGTDGAELTATVELPPGAAGALLLEYRADGGYAVEPAAGGGLVQRGELGDVHMGAAVALEPDGTRTPLELVPHGTGFRFLVPADVVARSRGRVVIDPLITSGTVNANPTREDLHVDVAADRDAGFLVAIERAFSAADSDVFVYSVPATGGVAGTLVSAIDMSAWSYRKPSIAARWAMDDFLVACVRRVSFFDEVWCRRSNNTGTVLDPPFFTLTGDDPDVAAETTGIFLLKRWIVAAVNPNGTPDAMSWCLVGGGFTSVAPIGQPQTVRRTLDISQVAVAETTGLPGPGGSTRFLIGSYEGNILGGRIWVDQYDRDGTLLASDEVATTGVVRSLDLCSLGAADLGPFLSTYAVAYGVTDQVNGTDEVHVVAAGVTGPRGAPVRVGDLMDTARDVRRYNPSIASDGEHWTLSFEEEEPLTSGARRDVVVIEGSYAGGAFGLTDRRSRVVTPFLDDRGPATIAMAAGGEQGTTRDRVLTAFVGPNGTLGALSEPIPERAAGVQECEGNPNSASTRGAWLSALGASDVTSPKTIRLQEAPANQFSLLFTASSPGFVPGIGGSEGNLCLGPDNFGRFNAQVGVIGADGVREVALDPTAIPQANGTTAAAIGQTWIFQAWYRDSRPAGPTSNLSNAVRIRFDH